MRPESSSSRPSPFSEAQPSPSARRQRRGPPVTVNQMDRDLFFPPLGPIRPSMDTARSDASTLPFRGQSFDIENPPPRQFSGEAPPPRPQPQPRPRKKGLCWDWQYRCDQSLTLRTIFRWLPFLAIAISATAAFFGIKNYLFLESSRATVILRSLQPILIEAHREIIAKLDALMQKLERMDSCRGPGPGPGPSLGP